jgi:hypothetical protein
LKLFQDYTGNKAVCIFFGNEDNYIILPYFERPISSLGYKLNSEYIDLVSPWYYGGPIHNIKGKKILQELFSKFRNEFHEHCINNHIVTEFQRFNPILKNYELFLNEKSLFYDRKIPYVELTKDFKTIRSEYKKYTRKNVRIAKRKGLTVYSDESKKSVSKFIEIYTESMKSKGAKDFYYFNEAFFNDLFRKFKGFIKLFHVEYKDNIICSSIELGNGYILHDYLRGADVNYLNLRPNDLLIDEVIKWAKSSNYKYFSLQGGISSSDDDGVYRFKKSFSSTFAKFYIYKKIINLKIYKELCRISGKIDLKYENAEFFPEYLSLINTSISKN